MKTETKVIIGLVITALIGGFIWMYFDKKKKAATAEADKTNDKADTKVAAKQTATFPLKYGSVGKEVIELQKVLNLMIIGNAEKLETKTGIFGPKTLSALKKYTGKTSVSEAEYLQYKIQLS